MIEINPVTIRELHDQGVTAFYGDAGSDELLTRAGVREARVLVVTISDLMAARSAIVRARHLNPEIMIITRAVSRNEVRILREAGADEIIQPEFEAGLECTDHMLRTLGVPETDVRFIVGSHRIELYEDIGDDRR